MKLFISILILYLIGVLIMFIFRYKYYKKNLISKYKSKASWYAIIESIKWPELIGFTLLVIGSIIIEDIKIRRRLKNRK